MSKEEEDQRLENWLPKAVDRLIEKKGRIEGQYDALSENHMAKGIYSWLAGIHAELLSSFRVMDELNDEVIWLRKSLTSLVGLDVDADKSEIARTVKELREIFVEMRRVRGEREAGRANET